MKEIRLVNYNQPVLVDDEDSEFLSRFRWYLSSGVDHNSYYAITEIEGKTVSMHTLVMGSPPKPFGVDHVDLDGLNNQKKNLRICTTQQNSWNRRKGTGTSSKYKGVYWSKSHKKWQVSIQSPERKRIFLGRFGSEIDAAICYDTSALKFFGEFARLNFPKEGPTEPTLKEEIN